MTVNKLSKVANFTTPHVSRTTVGATNKKVTKHLWSEKTGFLGYHPWRREAVKTGRLLQVI